MCASNVTICKLYFICYVHKFIAMGNSFSDLQEINPDYSLKGLITEAEVPILRPPDAKSWLIQDDTDARKDWWQEENKDDRGWDGWMASPIQ